MFRRNEVSREMREHMEMLEEEFLREGMPPEEAAAAARRRFGNRLGALETSREQWPFAWLGALGRDLRFAWRLLRRQPGLTAAAVLIAGLGVGANTAIVSVLETVMLNPLGLRDTDRILVPTVRIDRINMKHAQASGVEYKDLRAMTDVFEAVAAAEGRTWTFQSGGEPLRLPGSAVTADFFRAFHQRPALGRFFNSDDRDSLVLSYSFWKSRFGLDPAVVGRTLLLNGRPYRVVGIAEEGFRFPVDAAAWSSLDLPASRLTQRGYNMNLTLLARLANSATPALAAGRVDRYLAALKSTPEYRADYGVPGTASDYGYFIDLESFGRFVAGDLRRPLILLWAAALAVLFTACANTAVLLLSRTSGRRREMAIRLSLGATRIQILRQLAVESLLLGLLGGACGVGIAAAALQSIGHIPVPGRHLLDLVRLDWRLMGYGMALALASGLVFGLAPAIQLLRAGQASSMTRGPRHRFQDVFIAAQIAAALVLLVSTGLLLKSLWMVERIQTGFDPSNLTTAFVSLPKNDPGFTGRLEARLKGASGVEAGALAYPIPFTGGGLTSGFVIEGRPQPPGGVAWHGEAWFVSPGYFDALRIPILRGRGILPSDALDSPHVCVIDKKFADRFFPGEDPIGRSIGMYGRGLIVGVAADIRDAALDSESRATVYYAMAQQTAFDTRGVIVRSRIPGAPLIRAAVRDANPAVPVSDLMTMSERIDQTLGIRRVVAGLVSVFAGICILLAAIGLHGVVAQVVGERSAEIAVRMALGARPRQILAQFLRYGLGAGAVGILTGTALSLYVHTWLGNLLFDARPFDSAAFVSACLGLLIVLSLAVLRPALSASRTQPRDVLRHE